MTSMMFSDVVRPHARRPQRLMPVAQRGIGDTKGYFMKFDFPRFFQRFFCHA